MLALMTMSDSILDAAALAEARALLSLPQRPECLWPVLTAAGLLAISSLVFATAMIVSPPVTSQHTAKSAPG
jgi:hypothetical protein